MRVVSFLDFAKPCRLGGIAHVNRVRFKVTKRHRAGSQYRSMTDRYARTYERLGSDPTILTKCDRLYHELHFCVIDVVSAGAEVRALRDHSIGLQSNPCH